MERAPRAPRADLRNSRIPVRCLRFEQPANHANGREKNPKLGIICVNSRRACNPVAMRAGDSRANPFCFLRFMSIRSESIRGCFFCACKRPTVTARKNHEHHQKPRNASARHLSDHCWDRSSLSHWYPFDRDRNPGARGRHFDSDRQVGRAIDRNPLGGSGEPPVPRWRDSDIIRACHA